VLCFARRQTIAKAIRFNKPKQPYQSKIAEFPRI
jgi:hypothetical protein